jgi:competence protein ComEC
LPGAFQFATADLTLCPVKSYSSKAFENFAKYANQKGNGITIPNVGDTYALGSATVTILGLNADDDPNNTSIILRIDYGETSFLFTGDAERAAEQAVLNSGMNLSATVLKVGHHGSDSSTTYPFLREIMPQYAIISVGNDNTYGHPTEDTLSRLRDADVKLFRTDLQGDIFCTSDGKTVSFSVTRNPNADVFGDIGNNSTQPPSEPPATEPTDPATPTKPSEPEYDGLQILSWPETIGRNETGSVKIKGKANTEYKITVYYKSGPSSASGLEAKTSDAEGYVSWTWKVGGRTSPGTFKIVVEGGGEKATVEFTVTQ